MSDQSFVVYTHRDAEGRALYVGQSMRLAERTATHSATKPWWRDEALDALERRLIRELDPLHNRTHSPRAAREREARRVRRPPARRPRIRPDLTDRIDAIRGDVPYEKWVNRALERDLERREKAVVAPSPSKPKR
jgi:hypothetical protein